MGLDLRDSVHLLRYLKQRDKELRARNVLGDYDSILLGNAANFIEEALDNPDKSMTCIKGENPYLGWLLLMAFRYAVGRHFTQSLKDIDRLILDNIHLLCDDFVGQMIRDINDQYRIYNITHEKQKDAINPNYLEPFRQACLKELESRGCPYRSYSFDEYDRVP